MNLNLTKTLHSIAGGCVFLFLFLGSAAGQNFEITPHIGGQINGGLDLSTSIFHRIEVGNSLNYGVTVGDLLGEH